jgi:RecA/RadA recombinase
MAKQKQKSASSADYLRSLTPEARRKLYLSARKDEKPDFQVLKKDWVDELVPYGLITFDSVLGLGGISRHGRVTQVHGNEGVGKSTLTYVIAKNYQAFTGEALGIFDFEGTGTPSYLEQIGVDMEMVYLVQPNSTEKAIQKTVQLLSEGCRYFIYDSIPAMKSMIEKKDIDSGKAFKSNYGRHAQTMTRFFDILSPYMKQYDGHMLMVNQTRARIDDSNEAKYANDYSFTNLTYTLPGGRICRFVPSVMIELRMAKDVKPLEEGEGGGKDRPDKDPFVVPAATKATEGKSMWNRVRARTLKNKVTGAGYREGYIWVEPGKGINDNMSVRELGRAYDYIANSGAKWYVGKSKEEAIAGYPSKEAAIEDLVEKENPEVLGKLKELLAEAIAQDSTNRHVATVTDEEVHMAEGDDEVSPPEDAAKGFDIEEDVAV